MQPCFFGYLLLLLWFLFQIIFVRSENFSNVGIFIIVNFPFWLSFYKPGKACICIMQDTRVENFWSCFYMISLWCNLNSLVYALLVSLCPFWSWTCLLGKKIAQPIISPSWTLMIITIIIFLIPWKWIPDICSFSY